ncbi:hypothetical protein CC86DRAFT_353686 [Ophiobolus disseminans]|uniref:Vacuolar import and degradation protein-domain-containing protein n=1 Tax=Ophiobolus disseminans TaxID=1469910 RepID=A0A6A6ZV90_9PLEO|nr:hypothetical protein CC86DRAFT_353686 [Ophiobolus disseminans]
MPPANSPDNEFPEVFLDRLAGVGDGVRDLAGTLGVGRREEEEGRAQDERRLELEDSHLRAVLDDSDRLDYLRREQIQVQDRLHRSREHLRVLERQRQEADQRERLRRVMSRLSRLDDSTPTSSAAYGDRVPSQNSLYDWSPANEADDEDELDHILAELRREQPNTHPEILRVLGRSQLDSERERIRSISSRLASERAAPAGESLRSTAILQSVRRQPRFSARSRDYLQRYNAEREAAGRTQHSESQTRFMSESARQMSLQRLSDSRNNALDRERRDMLSRAGSYRRSNLDHLTSNPTPATSPLLEHTVKYLSRIRHSETIDDSLNHALDAGFLSKDYLGNYADFVTDVGAIPPPAETSWLAPGAVLSGCQHATSVAAAAPAPGTSGLSSLTGLTPPPRPWLANSYSTPRSRTAQLSPETTSLQSPQQDRWPVKVTIHEVDWERMTLSATMEAYNVPSHPHSLPTQQQHYTRTSSITTYLEGEILDFNQHTLLTESFKSNPGTDATYWRKLPPFSALSDDEVVRALTSKKFLKEVLGREWVLMRWKERCFVKSLTRSSAAPVLPPPTSTTNIPDGPIPSLHSHHISASQNTPYRLVRDPSTNELQVEITYPPLRDSLDAQHATFDDSGCGLTISGFYYVCLRRSDGLCEGLYFDPQSSPYQCLRLESRRGWGRGAWGFR